MKRANGQAQAPTLDPAIRVPADAATLPGFRAWVLSDAFPEHRRVSYIRGELFIDLSPEELDTHNKVKTEVARALGDLNRNLDLGEFFGDGTLVTNEAAELSTEPDATFVGWPCYEAGRVRLVARRDRPGQYVELQGTPDWVLEVVSRSSVEKDTRVLRAAYHRAGVPEYWLIDARSDSDAIDFRVLRRRRDRHVATTPRDGWLRSPVFGRGFRLERRRNRLGRWHYTLQIAPD